MRSSIGVKHGMAAQKRNKAQREADLAAMAVLVVKGATEREIANQFGLSPATAHRDVEEIEQRWRDRAYDLVQRWKGRMMAVHDRVAREAWEEWERSKRDAEKLVEITELVEPGTVDETGALIDPTRPRTSVMETVRRTETRMGRTGDPRYLAAIESALSEQAKLIGAHAAQKHEHGGEDGGPIRYLHEHRHYDLSRFSADELDELDRLAEKYEAGQGVG